MSRLFSGLCNTSMHFIYCKSGDVSDLGDVYTYGVVRTNLDLLLFIIYAVGTVAVKFNMK